MKFNKQLLTALSICALCSCTNGFDTINKDPLAVKDVSPDILITDMQYNGFHVIYGDYQRGVLLYSSLYSQYFANVSTAFTSGNYMFNASWAERGLWNPYYINMMTKLRSAEKTLGKHPEYEDMYRIMCITTVINTIRMTDLFGDIPYFEAGKGNSLTSYDSQKSIYYDVFEQLTKAVEQLKKGDGGQLQFGDEDLIYQGDKEKWIKLANSLRLRAALRLSFIDPDKAKAEGEAALKEGLLASNDDNAAVTIPVPGTWANPLLTASFLNEFRASNTLVNILKHESSVVDPRLPLMISQTEAYVSGDDGVEQYSGVSNGLPASDLSVPENDYTHNSNIWGYMWGYSWNSLDKGAGIANNKPTGQNFAPIELMNYSEVCFLKAEAALRGWSGAGNAKDNYEAGIRASFENLRKNAPAGSYSTANDNTYITTGNVVWNEADDFETKLKKIITQKWLGVYPNSDEAWAEFRRTGYPALTPIVRSLESSINPANGEFIKKLRYVDNELINNKENAANPALNGGKGDGVNVRVWWDTGRYK